ncbi:MAG: hypothetical protein ACE5G9_09825 [Nitrospinales bacterium]
MKTGKRHSSKFCFLMVLVLFSAPMYNEKSEAREFGPPDVFNHVALVRAEIELIRQEMGKPKLARPEIQVTEVSPREVYFQALILYDKANRLCSELTGRRATPPPRPTREIHPTDVLTLVGDTLECLMIIKKELNINKTSVKPQRDASKTPSDVFRSIVQASRQLNLMLERRIAPSDVYQRITQAMDYTAFLLKYLHVSKAKLPPPPPFERGKMPSDVYFRLIECFNLIKEIAQISGLHVLKANLEEDQSQITPGDVFILAKILVAELAYLNQIIGNTHSPRSFYPGRKFPSHVYQAAGLFQIQLGELLKRVRAKPDWLKQ